VFNFLSVKDSTMDKVQNLRISKCYLSSLESNITEDNFGLVSPGVMFSNYSQHNNKKSDTNRQYKKQIITE
jgi:hypothetical protein